MNLTALLDRLHRPEHTGSNRCLPCTVVNLAIVVLVGGVIGRKNRPGGLLAVTVGAGLVTLRGYIVPGTPLFAPRLVAPLPIDFGHTDRPDDSLSDSEESLAEETDPEAVLEELVVAGVIDSDGESLFLDEAFRDEWEDRMTSLRTADDTTLLERIEAACPGDVEGERYNDRIFLTGAREIRTSRPIAIAETAAIETLVGREFPESLRAQAATPLRNFLQVCPGCGGSVEETTVGSCCGGSSSPHKRPEQPVLACRDCRSVVVEL